MISAAVLARRLGSLRLPDRTRALLGDGLVSGDRVEAAATQRARRALARAASLLASGDSDAARYGAIARALSGLGPGLTPTGDDLLVSLSAASSALRCDPGAVVALRRALAALPVGLTTPRAASMIAQAAAGRFPEELSDVVRAPSGLAGRAAAWRRAVDRLAATGAHTGADMLAGVVALARARLACGGTL